MKIISDFMGLTRLEWKVLEYVDKKELNVIPEDLRNQLTPEMLKFTLEELQDKGFVELIGSEYVLTRKAKELFKKRERSREVIIAWGHPEITANSVERIEITKEEETKGKDSIIGVKANKACVDLNDTLKEYLKLGAKVRIIISVTGEEDEILAHGSPALKLTSKKSIAIEKTDQIAEDSIAILSNKSAKGLKESLKKLLKDPHNKIEITIELI